MLYLGLAGFLFVMRYVAAGHQTLSKQLYFVVLFALFVFSAFRFQVGCDWGGYFFRYTGVANRDWTGIIAGREPIWWAILKGIYDSGLPYPVANIISSAIFFAGVHVLARRQPDPLAFLIFLFPILIINMPMSGIRQGAAIGIMCVAFTAFIDRRTLWFGFWILLATGFHTSAIIFMLLLPLVAGRFTLNRLIYALALSVPGAFYLLTGDAAATATSRYIGTSEEAFGAVYRVAVLTLTGLYFFAYMRSRWKRISPSDYKLASIGALGMIFALALVPISSVLGDRFGYYLIPIQAMIFARIPFFPVRNYSKIHSALPYLGLLLVFGVWTQISYHFQACYVPYQSWLFGFPGLDLFVF